jgi:hypothetical protein
MNYLLGLPLNCNPPDLCLPSSYDYRGEPPAPGLKDIFKSDTDTGDEPRTKAELSRYDVWLIKV